jgi:predicted nuclease of predicted toxin-antitoxin system
LTKIFPPILWTSFGQPDFDADSVFQEQLSGAPDESVLARSRTEDRVLITLDLDFSNIILPRD